ncbi:protein FAM83D [Pelobates fuscus]|uniref:protein FAM83D n=1 Tax=Pelobates fuscus TaxID=191477 RepID=UPI002FE4BED6
MANLSQCLDDAPLGSRLPAAAPPDLYSEAQRLALEELVSGGPVALRGFLQKERVPGFLSEPEVGEILSCAASLHCPDDELSVSASVDCSSVTYFPERSDVEPPMLELGWPAFSAGSYRGATRVETHFQPSYGETIYSCKEAVRALIRAAREVIAVVMDTFTDNDLFRDMHEACRKRRVPVYILVDQSHLPHFLTMCQNLGVSLETEQLMRVRTLNGSNYYTRSGAKIVGKARERFLLVDGLKVATGSYSYTWMDGKLNSSNLIVLSGQVVEKFDLQFRVLYAQSSQINAKSLSNTKNRAVSLDQLLCNLPSHRKTTVSNLVQMELAKLSSTPKRVFNTRNVKEVPPVDAPKTSEDEWLQNCDIISGLKEMENVATQTEPCEFHASIMAMDAATQTSVSSSIAATQTFMPARVASTQTVVFSREMTTQTSQTSEPLTASVGQSTTTYSTGIKLPTTSSTSSSSSSSSASTISTGSSASIRSIGMVGSRLQQSDYPLRDNIKKLTKERQYHYSTIRSKLDHMVSILSRKNRFGSSYLGCEPAGYGFQRRDVMHSSLLNLRDGARFGAHI